MSFLVKNRDTLTQLFSTFNLQEILLLNQNLNSSWHLLTSPPAQLLLAMKERQVNITCFLGKKCLPLIRFYLASQQSQKTTFLSMELLTTLFISLPAVEATVFKAQIQKAQYALQQTNQALSELLSGQVLKSSEKSKLVVQFNHYQSNNKPSLTQLAEMDKKYLNCFYYLQAGDIFVVAEGQGIDVDMLLYSELSPLQQLKAQQLVGDEIVEVSVSA
ncbi:hypothetical protein [Psychromonas hadalis]|uniref:hypothetical protein n=1 Tax=Psychromonas hadalis TaxID=211669 RepID=UPI0003B34EE3|nr:hypothetical protein [Psychromonas hadalis]